MAGTTFVWKPLVAYKALGLTDHLLWVTDKRAQPAARPDWASVLGRTSTTARTRPQRQPDRCEAAAGTSWLAILRDRCASTARCSSVVTTPMLRPRPGRQGTRRWGSTQLDLWTAPRELQRCLACAPTAAATCAPTCSRPLSITEDTGGTDAAGPPSPPKRHGEYLGISLAAPDTVASIWDSDQPQLQHVRLHLRRTSAAMTRARNAVVDTLNAPDLFARPGHWPEPLLQPDPRLRAR